MIFILCSCLKVSKLLFILPSVKLVNKNRVFGVSWSCGVFPQTMGLKDTRHTKKAVSILSFVWFQVATTRSAYCIRRQTLSYHSYPAASTSYPVFPDNSHHTAQAQMSTVWYFRTVDITHPPPAQPRPQLHIHRPIGFAAFAAASLYTAPSMAHKTAVFHYHTAAMTRERYDWHTYSRLDCS